MNDPRFRVDLHVHSRYSARPSQWILQKIGCPESFTEPRTIYDLARSRGMDLVTITDHNTIDGALEIAHLPNTFVSEEITTYFPEDRCKLHVLAYDITEEHHREIQHVRDNVFELAAYLREQDIVHVLAHPLFAVNDKLTVSHFERALLLFDIFEENGTREAAQNRAVRSILSSLTPSEIERLAHRHKLAPLGETPWQKGVTGGSDDHSSLNIARMHTVAPGKADVPTLLQALRERTTRPGGTPATPRTMAHNLYSIAYQFYRSRLPLSHAASEHICMRFAEHTLTPGNKKAAGLVERFRRLIGRGKAALHTGLGSSASVQEVLLKEAARIISRDSIFMSMAAGEITDVSVLEEQWARFVSLASNRVLSHLADKTLRSALGANLFDIFHTVGSAGSLYALLVPYFVGYDLFSGERAFARKCLERFGLTEGEEHDALRIAHFTDTLDQVNGVARTITQQLSMVARHHKNMTVVTSGAAKHDDHVADFEPVGRFTMPEYPDLTLAYPPLLDMLAYCFDQRFHCILAATPGPVGMAGLAISRILKLPFHGTYHTAFPQYVAALTEDATLEEGCWRFMSWFYNQMAVIYAPSEATRTELAERGIDPGKITTYPRGVDTLRFHPNKRNGFYRKFKVEDRLKLLYVGRVSKEKGLDLLTEAFAKACRMRPSLQLIVVGEGPYLDEMQRALRGKPLLCTGVLEGEALAQAYASADIFVFPSATDTFGNVVLEAQASGLPVIVTDQGGPCENMLPNETGLVFPAGDMDALLRAMMHLVDYPERIEYMRKKARAIMRERTFDATFLKTWELFHSRIPH